MSALKLLLFRNLNGEIVNDEDKSNEMVCYTLYREYPFIMYVLHHMHSVKHACAGFR